MSKLYMKKLLSKINTHIGGGGGMTNKYENIICLNKIESVTERAYV